MRARRDRRSRAGPGALAALAVLVGAGEARAERAGEAAVVTVPSPSASPEEATAAVSPLAGALERASGIRVMLPQLAVSRLAAAEGQRRLDEARARAALARREMRAFEDLERAARLLDEAAEAYLDLLPMLDSIAEPLSLLTDLATVRLAQDRPEDVDAALGRAARLDPGLGIDPERTPPRLQKAAARVRAGLAEDVPLLEGGRAARYAELLGVSRLAVARLDSPARLRVDVYRATMRDRAARVDLDPARRPESTRALGEALGISLEEEALADLPPPVRTPSRRPAPAEPEPAATPWYRAWWLWTTVAVALAGAVLVGVFVGTSLD